VTGQSRVAYPPARTIAFMSGSRQPEYKFFFIDGTAALIGAPEYNRV
jgi:hypothetical protein